MFCHEVYLYLSGRGRYSGGVLPPPGYRDLSNIMSGEKDHWAQKVFALSTSRRILAGARSTDFLPTVTRPGVQGHMPSRPGRRHGADEVARYVVEVMGVRRRRI